MKICITSEGKTLDSKIDVRFGRCKNFIFVDADTLAFEAVENPHTLFQGGAGVQSAQFIVSHDAKAVLTGNVGPNAFKTLSEAGVEAYVEMTGTVMDALTKYKSGQLTPAKF